MENKTNDLKITVEQLKNYLGTGLRMEYSGHGEEKAHIVEKWSKSLGDHYDIHFLDRHNLPDDDVLFYFKPICYRLSDLDKFNEDLGFVPLEELENGNITQGHMVTSMNFMLRPFWVAQKLFEWHFWPFGDQYFEAGLVINKMDKK